MSWGDFWGGSWGGTPQDAAPPPTPFTLTVISFDSSSVSLSCTAVAGATGYSWEQRLGSGSYSVFTTTSGTTATSSGLTPGATYTFRVQALGV